MSHDGDCWFHVVNVCTCGLLHRLMWAEHPENKYPAFQDEYGKHRSELERISAEINGVQKKPETLEDQLRVVARVFRPGDGV